MQCNHCGSKTVIEEEERFGVKRERRWVCLLCGRHEFPDSSPPFSLEDDAENPDGTRKRPRARHHPGVGV